MFLSASTQAVDGWSLWSGIAVEEVEDLESE